MFEIEIKEYEDIRKEYQQKIADRMSKTRWMEYNEILFAQPTSLRSKRFAPKALMSSSSRSSSRPPSSE